MLVQPIKVTKCHECEILFCWIDLGVFRAELRTAPPSHCPACFWQGSKLYPISRKWRYERAFHVGAVSG